MHKHTRICTYMHMFICTHVYLFTQIFLCTRVHARVCTHTQKTDLWITEYPKALPRNGVKFKKPSYTQKRLVFFGGGDSGATDNRKRQKEYNVIFSQGKQSPLLKLPEERILPTSCRPWRYFYPCEWDQSFSSCLEVATTVNATENSQVFSPELLMQKETQATIRTNVQLPLELPPRWRRDTKFSVSFFEMIKQKTPGNSSNIWPILSLP